MANIIYSKKKIEGIDGRYIDPVYFDGCVRGVTKVYTDHKHIKEAYIAKGVEVVQISAKKTTNKAAKGAK